VKDKKMVYCSHNKILSMISKNSFLFRIFLGFTFVTVGIFLSVGSFNSVQAANVPVMTIRDEAYSARYVGQSLPDPIVLTEGETKTVVLKFKNTGSTTWNAGGTRYVSAFTIEPKYRTSEFRGASWKGKDQTASIVKAVQPGETAELPVELRAGKPGVYKEQFYLAAYNHTWIHGGYFYLDIKVVPATSSGNAPSAAITPTASENALKKTGTYLGERAIVSKKEIVARPGEKVKVRAHFRNIGTAAWSSFFLRATTVGNETISFSDGDWTDSQSTKKVIKNIAPKFLAENTFFLTMPTEEGHYVLKLQLEADGISVAGAMVEIPITVSQNLESISKKKPVVFQPNETELRLSTEPTIKIGLWEAPKTVEFWTPEDDYIIFDDETEVGRIPKNITATISHTNGVIVVSYAEKKFTLQGIVRLVPSSNPSAVFELKNFSRTVSWKKNTNYNKYRGNVILQFGKKDKQFWVINETLFEDYVAGIAETGNDTHPEYQKALLIAARTYAYYLKSCACKYGSFDVVPSTADQLFLGYNAEIAMPNIRKAANDTRGMMITYDTDNNPSTPSEIVITPYFSNTDGRTRSWSEVWGGKDKPWLVSVEATYDKRDGKKLWGHGVGMSNRDAIIRAVEGKATWEEILKYYYTGVGIERVY